MPRIAFGIPGSDSRRVKLGPLLLWWSSTLISNSDLYYASVAQITRHPAFCGLPPPWKSFTYTHCTLISTSSVLISAEKIREATDLSVVFDYQVMRILLDEFVTWEEMCEKLPCLRSYRDSPPL